MVITSAEGQELQKAQSNSPEDLFNRSTVTYLDDGKEKVLHVVYVRYFDEKVSEFSFFEEGEELEIGNRKITFKDIVALSVLLHDQKAKEKKRIYISDQKELASYVNKVDKTTIIEVFRALDESGQYAISS